MANALLQLSDISLTFGGNPLFAGVNLVVEPGARMALVGRNGSGKSTLMKLMAGRVEPDAGTVTRTAGHGIRYLEQDPDFTGFATLMDFACAEVGEAGEHLVLAAAEGLGFDPATPCEAASGGERRRAAIARFLAAEPELMLLDEPTNHLDITAIGWLEERVRATRAAVVVISHDRAFLRATAKETLWLDRGELRRLPKGIDHFEDWRDKVWQDEDLARHKLDRKIKAEGKWAVEGISARRKRNQGRVRALQAMRAERAAQIRRQGTAALELEAGEKSGRLVIEATGISKSFVDVPIIRDFSLRVMRGDRIALVGPNGIGKTTLLRLLMREIAPDAGTVRHGTNLTPAVFDQTRAALDPEKTLWETLTEDPSGRVSGRSDQVMVRGTPRHVVGYLKDFLFDEAQARAPVRSLSGGEKARLLLARLLARESNLLVMDEPTNDLDVETLDLLQDLLSDYPGTVLIVSHDRDFLDRVASVTLGFEGRGRVTVHAGGWKEYHDAQGTAQPEKARKPAPKAEKPKEKASGLSFTERHRLEKLPAEIDRLTAEIAKLEQYLAAPDLYAKEPAKFAKASEALAERMSALSAAETEWLDLAEKAEG